MKSFNRSWLTVMVAAGVVFSSPFSHAQTDDPWYISPMISFFDDDKDRGDEDEFAGGQVVLGKPVTDTAALELNLGLYNLHDSITDAGTKIRSFGVDVMFHSQKSGRITPYLLGGLGLVYENSFLGGSSTNLGASVGAGVLGWVGDSHSTAIRGEARRRMLLGSPHHSDVTYSIGFLRNLGKKAPPPPPDSDGDGVNDNNDRCPGTPAGVPVNSRGCELDGDGDGVVDSKDSCPNTPAGTKVDMRGCAVKVADSDGDGVPDSKDACPNTPRGIKVNARGCELDSDGDGVGDSKDRCPGTRAGVRVDVNGCEIVDDRINLPGVQFELNSAKLKSESFNVLNDAAATLDKYKDLQVEVAGHTDSSGADSYNMSLSEKRAKSVLNYLVSRGVDAGRLKSRGYGETQPIADNATKAGRMLNRRVELNILN
ncbi:MAG: OmpA family protein [Gammaproteobacteria bacterium]|nr:OmpA family protein [Gammaproteobacteria bacterium]